MAGKQVNWTANALAMVSDIYDYIESQAGESKASDYIDALLDFGNTLNEKSEHHAYCRNIQLQEKGYRCAQFRKTYILIYAIGDSEAAILAVIQVKRNPKAFGSI